jgi:predicted Zn-dependent protease
MIREERLDEAIAQAKQAQQLDSLSPLVSMTVGSTYYRAGHYDDAIRELEKGEVDGASQVSHTKTAAHRLYRTSSRRKGFIIRHTCEPMQTALFVTT